MVILKTQHGANENGTFRKENFYKILNFLSSNTERKKIKTQKFLIHRKKIFFKFFQFFNSVP